MATGEENGNPLQYSCLENPMDGGACYSPWDRKESDVTEWRHFLSFLKEKTQLNCIQIPKSSKLK